MGDPTWPELADRFPAPDPESVGDLRLALSTHRSWIHQGYPVALWELFCLLRTHPAFFFPPSGKATVAGPVAPPWPGSVPDVTLEINRRRHRRWVDLLHRARTAMPEIGCVLPEDWEATIGVLLLSPGSRTLGSLLLPKAGRESPIVRSTLDDVLDHVGRYMTAAEDTAGVPDAPAPESRQPFETLVLEIHALLRRLQGGRDVPIGREDPFGSDPSPAIASLLRDVFEVCASLRGAVFPVRLWEALAVRVEHPASMAPFLERLRRDPTDPASLDRARFLQEVRQIRDHHALLAGAVEEEVARALKDLADPEINEIVVALLMASVGGRRRAARWMLEPGRHRRETSRLLRRLVSRACACRRLVTGRNSSAAPPPGPVFSALPADPKPLTLRSAPA